MKKIIYSTLMSLTLLCATQAFAENAEIDIQEMSGFVTTIDIYSNYPFNEVEQKLLSYRGQPEEVIGLFEAIVFGQVPTAMVNAEINDDTGTISLTVSVSGFLGVEHYYYTLTVADN